MQDFDDWLDRDVAATADGIRLRCLTIEASATPWTLSNASDTFLVILPLWHGQVRFDIGQEYVFQGAVQPGTVRFVQPGETASVSVQEAFKRAILFVPGSVFRRKAEPAGLRIKDGVCPEVVPLIRSNPAIQRLAPIFEMCAGLSVSRREMLVQGLAGTLMALLLDPDLHRAQRPTLAFDQAQFDQVLRFAKLRLGQQLDLAEWAASVRLSTGEFVRRFQQHTGSAPYTWFMDRRIDRAKQLMVQGGMPLVEVALEAGFCSQSHFTEAFRRRVGTSPGRWRKVHLQD